MLARVGIVVVLVVFTGLYVAAASHVGEVPARTTLHALPLVITGAEGVEAAPFADDVIQELGADEYVNRVYLDQAIPVGLYAGFYASQKQGDAIHSPQNCLPGAGWRPLMSDRIEIGEGATRQTINRVLITKGRERQAVFYWYQGRGRVVANEFANKAWLMLDAARHGRTDGGLVRLITPVVTTPEEAYARLTRFATPLIPLLWEHLP
jgi:EpsI family protein